MKKRESNQRKRFSKTMKHCSSWNQYPTNATRQPWHNSDKGLEQTTRSKRNAPIAKEVECRRTAGATQIRSGTPPSSTIQMSRLIWQPLPPLLVTPTKRILRGKELQIEQQYGKFIYIPGYEMARAVRRPGPHAACHRSNGNNLDQTTL